MAQSSLQSHNTSGLVEVRKATLEDYDGVLDINKNLYEGLDYIPCYYKELVTDPDLCFYVCTVDGEICAFEGIALTDNGNTLQFRAARVKSKCQGQGLLSHIRRQIHEDFKSVPGSKRIRTCCANNVRLVHSNTFRRENTLLLTKNLLSYNPVTDLTLPDRYKTEIPGVTHLVLDQLIGLFENKPLTHFLFPEGFFTSLSWFFEPVTDNIKFLKKLNSYISVSTSIADRLANQDQEGDDCEHFQGIFCVSSYYLTPTMLLYVLDIHGSVEIDKEEEEINRVFFHSMQQLVKLIADESIPKTSIGVCASLQKHFQVRFVEKILESLGFTKGKIAEAYNEQFFFEQEFMKLLK